MIEASLVIATYNRAAQLAVCLDALARQTISPTAFEVIVVVDGSTDGTIEWLDQFKPPYAMRVVRQSNRGQCMALNRGAEVAHGEICIFLDDDIVAGPELVAEHIRVHRQRPDAVGIGQLAMRLPATADWFTRGFARDWQAHYAGLDAGSQPTWQDCYGGNMSVARRTFVDSGGFDASLARAYDVELAYRLAKLGCSFVYLAHARGIQDQTKERQALLTDAERSGTACVELYRRHPAVLPILLGAFGEQRPTLATALRVLLAIGVAPGALERLDWLVRRAAGPDTAYQLLHRYSFWRGVHRAWPDVETRPQLTTGTPILMYHAFARADEPASRYVMPLERFSQQIGWLKRWRYRIISLDELLRYRAEHRLPPPRSVVITIDDGYLDTWTRAHSVLRAHRVPATVFAVTDRVGQKNDWAREAALRGRPLLSWSEMRRMHGDGVQFGAHTRSHADLTLLSSKLARAEIVGSRRRLEEQLGAAVRSFAYPYGKHSADVAGLVEAAGFDVACGINAGLNTPATSSHALRRVEIFGTDSLLEFALALRFGARFDVLWKRAAGLAVRTGGRS